MKPYQFLVPLAVLLGLALWGLARLVTQSSPDSWVNVLIALLLILVAASSLVAMISWLLIYYLRRENRPQMALRHGVWGGLFVVALPLLRWGSLLNGLMVGALLIALLAAEAWIMVRSEEPTVRRSSKRR